MACWQVVELRSPAKEGSDVLVSTSWYYDRWPNYYWNGNMWTCTEYNEAVNFWNTLGESYQISSVSGLLPIDIPPLFTLLECTQMAGPLCTGSGIPPNKTLPEGAPPLMIGSGPCELPFLVWQVDISASYHSRPWNLPAVIFPHILKTRYLIAASRQLLNASASYMSRIVNHFRLATNHFGFTTNHFRFTMNHFGFTTLIE